MPSTAATALQHLWSIVLSKVGASSEAIAHTSPEAGVEAGLKLSALRARKIVRGAPIPIPSHLSAKQAYVIVKMGIPSRSMTPLGNHLGIGKGAVARVLGLDRATATRKVANDDVLPIYAAESMLRLLELDALARNTFETPEEATAWLRQPHPMLDGELPIDCAKSGFGAELVKDILNTIKYGGVV